MGNSMQNEQLEKALSIMGLTQQQFAQALGYTSMAISTWKRRGVPIKTCVIIERMTDGQINRRSLRHDANEIWEPLV